MLMLTKNYKVQKKVRGVQDIWKFLYQPEGVEYEVGDHLENSEEIVESVALSFGLVLDSVFEIKKIQNEQLSSRLLATTIKGLCTVRNAFRYYADLSTHQLKRLLNLLLTIWKKKILNLIKY